MDAEIIKGALSTLESELEQAVQARNQMEAAISGSSFKGSIYEEPEEAFVYILNRIYQLLLVVLDVAGLSDIRSRLIEQWKWFEENGGLKKTTFQPEFDYLESKPYEYLKTLVDGLRISSGEALDPGDSYELAKLETILRKTATLILNRGVKPQSEQDVKRVMQDYLAAFFTEYKKSVRIVGIIRDFEPDCGIRNLKAAIEFKYAVSKDEVSKALSGIFEDVSGYKGSRDWIRFYSVIYQTQPFESEDRVKSELTRVGTITWKAFPVTGGGSRSRKRERKRRG